MNADEILQRSPMPIRSRGGCWRLSMLALVLAFAAACTETLNVNIKGDPLSTVGEATSNEELDYSGAFVHGRAVSGLNTAGVLRVIQIGKLAVPSGKIVACDPLVFFDSRPFTHAVPTGEFAVILSIARFEEDERVAFAKIVFSHKATIRWADALVDGPAATGANPATEFRYPVDSGTGSFMDAQTAEMVFEKIQKSDHNGPEHLSNRLIKEMEKNRVASGDWANFRIADSGLNLVIFSSGFGDGGYRSYFGLDKDGQVTELITDFEVIDP
jgi:hypothetical protein